MTERSRFWGGTTIGDAPATRYTDDDFSDCWAKLFTYDRKTQCVVYTERVGYTGLLEVTIVDNDNVEVYTGIGLLDGKLYDNDASKNLAVGGDGFYRVVLRKTWATQLVRLAILGPQAVVPPSVTQTDGTLWEVDLATFQKVAGVICAIINTPYRVGFAAQVDNSTIEISDDKLQVRDEGITHAKLLNRTRTVFLPADASHMSGNAVGVTYNFRGVKLTNASNDGISGEIQIPVDYVGGDIDVYFVWYHTASAGDIRVHSDYGAFGDGEDCISTGTSANITLADPGVDILDYASLLTLPDVMVVAEEMVTIHTYRDYNHSDDTLASDAFVVGLVFRYPSDS